METCKYSRDDATVDRVSRVGLVHHDATARLIDADPRGELVAVHGPLLPNRTRAQHLLDHPVAALDRAGAQAGGIGGHEHRHGQDAPAAILVGIVDTNCDPTQIQFPIPGNDDALRAIKLFTGFVADAIADARNMVAEGADQATVSFGGDAGESEQQATPAGA